MRASVLVALAIAGCTGGVIDIPGDTDPVDDCPVESLSATSLVWTDAYIGQPAAQALTITNDCSRGANLVISNAVIVDGPFAVQGQFDLGPGESGDLIVTYEPGDYGPHTGTLTFDTSVPGAIPWEVPLSGTPSADQDRDGFDRADDCDDFDPSSYPGGTEVLDVADNDCDGLVDEGFIEQGDVFFSELMISPQQVNAQSGQFIEAHNTLDHAVDLANWVIVSDDGDRIDIAGSFPIPPHGYAVLAVNGDPATNGGVDATFVYDYDDFPLSNRGGTLGLYQGGKIIFHLDYGDDWGLLGGRSLSLDSSIDTATGATQGRYWCAASSFMTGGDRGTPAAANDWCTTVDHDGDGYSEDDGDCDDAEASAFPGGIEVWDGIDNDCDGLLDDLQADEVAAGYVDGAANERLSYPGHIGAGDVDGDGLPEVLVGAQYHGTSAGAVYVFNAEDHGSFAGSASKYDAAIVEGSGYQNSAFAVGPVMGDNTGNGYINAVVAGIVYVGSSGVNIAIFQDWQMDGQNDIDDAYYTIGSVGAYTAASVSSNLDLNGDGVAEIAYGLPYFGQGAGGFYHGRVWVVDSSDFTPGDYEMSDADGIYDGLFNYHMLGTTIGGGDVDGDGYDDLIVRAMGGYSAGASGAYYMMSGSAGFGDEDDIDDAADAIFESITSVTQSLSAGTTPQVADFDGDGTADVALGNSQASEVYVFYDGSDLSGDIDTPDDADTTLSGSSSTQFGHHLASADIDDDGASELVISAPGQVTTPGSSAGAIYVFEGGSFMAASHDLEDAAVSFWGDASGDAFGVGLSLVDLDGDDVEDLVVGAPYRGSYAGRVWFIPTP